MTTHTFFAPCKLNLFLHITGKLASGYHSLQTIFLLLDYGDRLSLTVRTDGAIVQSTPLPGVDPEQDLCVRAARALQAATGCSLGVELRLEKHTPMGGGLGGGSSDAATVLLALNQLWGLHRSRAHLMALALTLGADVPFFVFGQTAWAEGVGEQLQAIALPAKVWEQFYVVITPQIQVPTAQIFAHQALTRDSKPLRIADFSDDAQTQYFWHDFRNDMQAVVCTLYPDVAQVLNWLSGFGHARMSGSGSSLFVAVDSEAQADKILQAKPDRTTGFKAKGLKYHPHFLGV